MNEPALRVWLGWRADAAEAHDRSRFVAQLREIFVPATWQVMRRFGLVAYVPSVPARGDGLPDETALLAYTGTAQYDEHKKAVAGRAYGLLHRAVFEFARPGAPPASRSAWAVAWGAQADARLPAWRWSAQAGGPVVGDASSRVIYLALRHPDETPSGLDVYTALGADGGECVVARAGTLSFAWLAVRGKRSAASLAADLAQAQPAWTVHAAHDGVRSDCEPDHFSSVTRELEFEDGQTLHFVLSPAGAA